MTGIIGKLFTALKPSSGPINLFYSVYSQHYKLLNLFLVFKNEKFCKIQGLLAILVLGPQEWRFHVISIFFLPLLFPLKDEFFVTEKPTHNRITRELAE